MVVWQGITEGGTAVPVQITEEGKVVAVGEAGPEGPRGPQGPAGPPGQAEWPPNPIEGAFLVWLNGEPTWYTEQPIPTPPGIAGPIIGVNENSLLTFESDLDQNIFFKAVQVYAVNADGSNWNGGIYNTNQVWSSGAISSEWDQPISNLFDGSLNTRSYAAGPDKATCSWTPITATSSIRVYGYDNVSEPACWWLIINGAEVELKWDNPDGNFDNSWYDVPATFPCQLSGVINNGVASARAIEVDGKILLDPLAGPYPTGQISTVANNSALLSRVQGVWTEGLYMKADESAQAGWLFSKNKNGTILR